MCSALHGLRAIRRAAALAPPGTTVASARSVQRTILLALLLSCPGLARAQTLADPEAALELEMRRREVLDLARDLAQVDREIRRTERVRMLDGLVYAGVPVALAGLGGLGGCSYAFANSTVVDFLEPVVFTACFIGAGALTIAGTVLAIMGGESIGSFEQRRVAARERRGQLVEQRREIQLRLEVFSMPGGGAAMLTGTF